MYVAELVTAVSVVKRVTVKVLVTDNNTQQSTLQMGPQVELRLLYIDINDRDNEKLIYIDSNFICITTWWPRSRT